MCKTCNQAARCKNALDGLPLPLRSETLGGTMPEKVCKRVCRRDNCSKACLEDLISL